MLTHLLANIDPLPDDQVIVHNLDVDMQANGLARANGRPIGIRNADGRIYRLVQLGGVGETVRLVRALQKLGFTEEDCESPAEGCGATFRRRLNTRH